MAFGFEANVTTLFDPAELEGLLEQWQAESIGWQPLEQGAYLHKGEDNAVVLVVGIAEASMVNDNVLLLT